MKYGYAQSMATQSILCCGFAPFGFLICRSDSAIESLHRMKVALTRLVAVCERRGQTDHVAWWHALSLSISCQVPLALAPWRQPERVFLATRAKFRGMPTSTILSKLEISGAI